MENTGRAWPSLELALRAMFGYDFWLVLPAVFTLAFLAVAVAANTWITWSQTFFGLTLDYSLNPATRFMVTPVLTVAAVTPLLLERAWTSASGERASPRLPRSPRSALLSWAIIGFAVLAYPASMLAGVSSLRLPGGLPSFPTRDECIRAPVEGEAVRVVLGYERSYVDANSLRERGRAAGLVLPAANTPALRAAANTSHAVVLSRANVHQHWRSLRPRPARFSPANHDRIYDGKHLGTADVARDGCGRLRVFVDGVPSIGAGEALAGEAREAGLEPTLEHDPRE